MWLKKYKDVIWGKLIYLSAALSCQSKSSIFQQHNYIFSDKRKCRFCSWVPDISMCTFSSSDQFAMVVGPFFRCVLANQPLCQGWPAVSSNQAATVGQICNETVNICCQWNGQHKEATSQPKNWLYHGHWSINRPLLIVLGSMWPLPKALDPRTV